MNLQPHHVVADVAGATGMRLIRAIVEGQQDPRVLVEMRDVRCKASEEFIRAPLGGNYQPEHVVALAHTHAHVHQSIRHAHPHYPDIHHRHEH